VLGNPAGTKGVSRDVTERIRLENEVAETRRYLENVLQGSMDAIVTTDMDGRVKIWNRGAEAIYGYTEDEALGKSIDKLTDPPGWSRKFDDIYRVVAAKGGWYSEEPVERRRKDGGTFYASASYSIIYDADAEPSGVCGITRDMTERLKAERFTQEALSRFESVLENVPNVAVQGFGPDGKIWHWNPAAERVFGISANDITGAGVDTLTFLPAKERRGFRKELDRVFATGKPNEPTEFSLVGPAGDDRWVYSQMFPVFVEGKVEEVFQMSVDITERRRTEVLITNAAEEWRRTFDAVPDSIAIIDDEYRILRLNKAMADRIGVHPRDAIGLTCYEEIHDKDGPHRLCPHSLLLKDGREHTAEIYDERMDKYFEVSVTPIADASGGLMGAVHVAHDTTERKRAEELLSKSEREKLAILENTSEFVVYMNKDMDVVWANKAAADWIGSEPDDLIGRKCYEIWFGYDDICENCHVSEVFRTGECVVRERRLPDDSVWTVRCDPVSDESGEIVGAVELSSDITERKRAEEALAKSEKMYRSLYDTTLALTNETEPAGVIKVIADRATELLDGRDCVVYMVDTSKNVLVPIYSNDEKSYEKIMAFEIPIGIGVSGRVAETGKGSYVNIGDEDDYAAHVPGTDETEDENESVLAVPMLDGNRNVLGVITVGRTGSVFDGDDLDKLIVFARQAEIAVKRARDRELVAE
jgi:PAS domain S-box-containing protein